MIFQFGRGNTLEEAFDIDSEMAFNAKSVTVALSINASVKMMCARSHVIRGAPTRQTRRR